MQLSNYIVINILAAIHMKARVEEGAVSERLVRVSLYDLLEVQLLAGVCAVLSVFRLSRSERPHALRSGAVRTEFHYLSAWEINCLIIVMLWPHRNR